jgi:hypothetical protein
LPEIIRESGGGLSYQTDDELFSAIERFSTDRVYRDETGRCGYQIVQQHYTVEHHLENYFALIKQIAARKGGKEAFGSAAILEDDSRQASK